MTAKLAWPLSVWSWQVGEWQHGEIWVSGDFPGGLAVKNLPSSAENSGSIPVWGTKIPDAAGQRSLGAITTEPTRSAAQVPQLETMCCNKDPKKKKKKKICVSGRSWVLVESGLQLSKTGGKKTRKEAA